MLKYQYSIIGKSKHLFRFTSLSVSFSSLSLSRITTSRTIRNNLIDSIHNKQTNPLYSSFSFPFRRNMNVHKYNFPTLWPDIEAALQRACFVAIDTEMTGLYTLPQYRGIYTDSLDSRYCRVRNSAQNLGLVQYGIAIFEYDHKNQTLICRPYSFHLWPQTSSLGIDNGLIGYGGDVSFTVTSESFTFLHEHNFNFNEWINSGISFLSKQGEDKIRHVRRLHILRKYMKLQEIEEIP